MDVPRRVCICGDRDWRDPEPIRTRLRQLPRSTALIHGAQRGVDRLAARIAVWLGWEAAQVEAIPADWDVHGIAAGPIRNQAMLDTGIDLVLAFHDNLSTSRGTADLVDRAVSRGIPVEIINSHGQTQYIEQRRLNLE